MSRSRAQVLVLTLICAIFALHWSAPVRAEEAALGPDEALFLRDVSELTRAPHRQTGSEAELAAERYVRDRLRGLGLTQVFELSMPVWELHTIACSLEVDGVSLPLSALRPDVLVPPVAPEGGLEAPLLYAGRGENADFAERSPEGKIVVLDYDSGPNWARAFSLGARAVIFLGTGTEAETAPKHVDLPINLLRLYAGPEALQQLDLRRDYPHARLVSEVEWRRRVGHSLVARIAGRDPRFAKQRAEAEALVLSARLDSFGIVPERTPGARRAANVAALLEAASSFHKLPPKRDVILFFSDGDAFASQGTRELYDAWLMSAQTAGDLAAEHEAELGQLKRIATALAQEFWAEIERPAADAADQRVLWRTLSSEADFARDDAYQALERLRLSRSQDAPPSAAESELEALAQRWDEIRRALHERALGHLVSQTRASARAGLFEPEFAELEQRVRGRCERRLLELAALRASDAERTQLRAALSETYAGEQRPEWVVLHAAYDFSGDGATWGAIVGDYSNRLFSVRDPKPEGDLPGYYGRVLNALNASAKAGAALAGLDLRTLDDPAFGLGFVSGKFESAASVAGSYGIYNLSLMTGYDGRARDGQPSDSLAALDWRTLRQQALAGTELLARAAGNLDLSLPRVFKAFATSKYPRFAAGESKGDYVGLQVTGTLSEDRPASGALLAVWPGSAASPGSVWGSRKGVSRCADYDPSALEAVDEHGRFRSIGLREDMYSEEMAIGARFDARGALTAISTEEQQVQRIADAMRVNLFSGRGFSWTVLVTHEADPDQLKVLKASADSPFRENRALWGQLGGFGFAYVSEQITDYRMKLFQPYGPVVLGPFTAQASFGSGVDPAELEPGARLSRMVAGDLWNLNERRLATLRERGVTSADLEILHARAKLLRSRAKASASVAGEEAKLMQSASLSQRVYGPLRTAMDDLVHAVVLLLLLAIPFSFALERLLLGSTTIYGRIAGFVGCFLATFGALYWLHPGFAIASTPVIIFLAFALVMLSGLVTNIVVRKFRTELHAMQGQGGGQTHDLEVSRAGTMIAAISMGVSTMRRRPARTALTAITVVLLTFTILCFASFSRTVGVRAVYQGPKDPSTRSALLLRRLDYSAILPAVLDLVQGSEGKGGTLAPEYWLVHQSGEPNRISVARPDNGAALDVDAVLSVSPDELALWPELSAALGSAPLAEQARELRENGVFLPAVVSEVLKLRVGDHVRLGGRDALFAGTIDSGRLQRLRQLDGESLLPVNPDAGLSLGQSKETSAASSSTTLADEAVVNVVHLASDQIVVASPQFVRELGGELRAINVYPGAGVDPAELGRRLSEIVAMPVWASGAQGVERLVFTILTDVSTGFALFVPLALGGLIIFGTLLGSISDREKEIYTFSALGLSPAHVGVLFFAEAAVYAVVGGMGGQILAELVGLGASFLARRGLIDPPGINYSSTNSLFAIALVMATVLISALYPALRASRSANPGLARSFRVPAPVGDVLELTFPFTVSAYDITGMVSFLAEHFRRHDDAGIGGFAASNTGIRKTAAGRLELSVDLALAPFDLGVTQGLVLTALPSEIPGVDEIALRITRTSGTGSDWERQNRVFLTALRRQFLLWRTLSNETIEGYRLETLELLGGAQAA
jgi:hypothetical protein